MILFQLFGPFQRLHIIRNQCNTCSRFGKKKSSKLRFTQTVKFCLPEKYQNNGTESIDDWGIWSQKRWKLHEIFYLYCTCMTNQVKFVLPLQRTSLWLPQPELPHEYVIAMTWTKTTSPIPQVYVVHDIYRPTEFVLNQSLCAIRECVLACIRYILTGCSTVLISYIWYMRTWIWLLNDQIARYCLV